MSKKQETRTPPCVLVCRNPSTDKIEVWALDKDAAQVAYNLGMWEIDSNCPPPESLGMNPADLKTAAGFDRYTDDLGWFVADAVRLQAAINKIQGA